MNYDKVVLLINELVTLAENSPITSEKCNLPYKSFGLEDGRYISFFGFEKVIQYQKSIEQLFLFNKEISETYSFEKFEDFIIKNIGLFKHQGRNCYSCDFEKIISNLLENKLKEYEILYDFYGATMDSPIIEFGDFRIYNTTHLENNLILKYPALQKRDYFLENLNSNLLVGVKVKARENTKATEIADKLCQSFENVFSYAIGDLSHIHRVGILNFRGWTSQSRLICNNKSFGFQDNNDIFFPLDLDDPFLKDSNLGNDKIWHLITKKDKNGIEERLLNAIEWIGKAINDRDLPKSLVQFVFAIEGMLHLNDKAFITPSIVSQLSDWLAFIIHEDKEERKKIAKYFRELYQKRSAIAHGANKLINLEDLELAKYIANNMVISFLVKNPYNDLKSMDKLNELMTDLKFT